MSFFENVYEAVQLIPRGKVATYGQIARMIGAPPRRARRARSDMHCTPIRAPASSPATASSTAKADLRRRSRSAAPRSRRNCSRAKASKWAKTSSSTSKNTFGNRAGKIDDLAAMIICDFDFLTYEKPPRSTAAAVCRKSRQCPASIVQTQSFFTFCHCSGVPR